MIVLLLMAGVIAAGWPMLGSRTNSRATLPQSGQPELAKEYTYAGGRLISTEEPQPPPSVNNAEFISQNIPSSNYWVTGQIYPVSVTMKNTGSTTWTNEEGYKLGSQSPPGNFHWGTDVIALPHPVPPNTEVTFSFNSDGCCAQPGDPNKWRDFQWQMIQDNGPGYFGELTEAHAYCRTRLEPVGAIPDDCDFVSQSVPFVMIPGHSYSVSVTMNNAGLNTWTSAANYKLGSYSPPDNTVWGLNRVPVPSSVQPGSDATFTFNITAPSTLGIYTFQWRMVQDGGAGWFGPLTQPIAVVVANKAALGCLDYNNDGITDIATWRSTDVKWRLDYNLDGTADLTKQFYNSSSHIPTPADYDGDGKADLSVFHPAASARFYIDFDGNGFPDYSWFPLGGFNAVPTPGDYNGDGQSDPASFNKSTGAWSFDIDHNGDTDLTINFGTPGDIPVPADYNLDGKTDPAVYRPSTGQWFIDTNQDGSSDLTVAFGQSGDIPIAMDFSGDGKADITIYRPSTGQWLIDSDGDGTANITVVLGGTSGDIPVAGDYNADGRVDIAIFRPSFTIAQWLIDTNLDGTADISVNFGALGYTPLRQNGWILKSLGVLPN